MYVVINYQSLRTEEPKKFLPQSNPWDFGFFATWTSDTSLFILFRTLLFHVIAFVKKQWIKRLINGKDVLLHHHNCAMSCLRESMLWCSEYLSCRDTERHCFIFPEETPHNLIRSNDNHLPNDALSVVEWWTCLQQASGPVL